MMDDRGLLHAYVQSASREALGEIVSRNIDFVYSAGLRDKGDVHAAEDVTQTVFVILLPKGARIRSSSSLTGWLFNTTRYAAANAMKMQRRRVYHEKRAARAEALDAEAAWDQM